MTDHIRFKFRLQMGKSIAMGPGKADLLTAVNEVGSISAAARAMGMSYKRAWYLIDTMNHCFRTPVVETAKGGQGRGSAALTPMGREALKRYRALEAKVAQTTIDDLAAFSELLVDTPVE